MYIIGKNHDVIVNPDLTKGHLVPCTIINPDAKPIDNINKFAWSDEDYIEAQMFIVDKEEPQPDPGEQYVTFNDLDAALSKGVNSI